MTYMIKRDGQESGPFTLEAMKEMHATGKIHADALFRRYGTDHWMASVDLDSELNAPFDPPALPAEPQPLGFKKSVKVWGMTLGGLFALGLVLKLFQPPGPSPEVIAARDAQRKLASAAWEAKVERESEFRRLGREHGKRDGISIAASVASGAMAKPSRVQIIALGISRAYAEKISNTNDQIVFLGPYEEVFKESYKETADW